MLQPSPPNTNRKALLAVIGLTVYAMMPFRAHGSKTPTGRVSSPQTSTSAPVRVGGVAQSTSIGG